MTLNQLLADGKLVKHKTSRQEIASLLEVEDWLRQHYPKLAGDL